MRAFSCLLLLLCLVCAGMHTRPAAAAEALEEPVPVFLEASTDPAAALAEFQACAGFAKDEKGPDKGTVADYLSRFYNDTNAFHKARRCDSFIFRLTAALPQQGPWYQVAVFSYDDARQVERVRKLEPVEGHSFRTPAKGDAPGLLAFKGPLEHYRVFFQKKRIIFFFWETGFAPDESLPPYRENPRLATAAREFMERCLKE